MRHRACSAYLPIAAVAADVAAVLRRAMSGSSGGRRRVGSLQELISWIEVLPSEPTFAQMLWLPDG